MTRGYVCYELEGFFGLTPLEYWAILLIYLMVFRRNRKRGAFSLIEILVALAIMAIVVLLAVPSLSTSKVDASDVAIKGTLYSLNLGLARAYKANDPEFSEGGYLHSSSTNAIEAAAYLVERGYVQ